MRYNTPLGRKKKKKKKRRGGRHPDGTGDNKTQQVHPPVRVVPHTKQIKWSR
jgi:hypothetical protein